MNNIYCLQWFDHDEIGNLIVSGFTKKDELFAVSRRGWHELLKFKARSGL